MSFFLDLIFPRHCYYCGTPGLYFCPTCSAVVTSRPLNLRPPKPLAGHLAVFSYNGPIRQAILDLKYQFITDLVYYLANLTATHITAEYPHLLDYWRQNHYVLLPIPLHPFRQNWRGFNQSALLAAHLSKILNIPSLSLLRRLDHSPSQTKVSRRFRFQKTKTLFSPDYPFIPSNIILLDDVYTTGSTILSAAAALPKNGQIWALTLAG